LPDLLLKGAVKFPFGGATVITYCGEGAKFQPLFQFAFDDIETVGGDAVFGAIPELGPFFFAQIPQGRAEFFARASGQLFQIEECKPRRLVGTDALAIEKTKRSQPAILLASDTIEEFAAPQPEPERTSRALAVILGTFGRVGKGFVGFFDAQKNSWIAGGRIVGVKAVSERAVYALDRFFIRMRAEPQNLVVIGGKAVFPKGDVRREPVFLPGVGLGVCQVCGRHFRTPEYEVPRAYSSPAACRRFGSRRRGRGIQLSKIEEQNKTRYKPTASV
jgi:hypothetical protein